ncbi:MAG: hypothetical protein IKO85_00875 [Bacteroidaceae bacterium]|nr:hypothetical protein [Bacteroidaceae bacterium]
MKIIVEAKSSGHPCSGRRRITFAAEKVVFHSPPRNSLRQLRDLLLRPSSPCSLQPTWEPRTGAQPPASHALHLVPARCPQNSNADGIPTP